MQDANLDYFHQKEIKRSEDVIATIECLHEGNPFVGTLILTDQRLTFVRRTTPGFEVLSIKSGLIVTVEQRIDHGLDFVLIVKLERLAQEFELRGIDMASKQAFVEQIQYQFDLCGEKVPSTDVDRLPNNL